MTFDVLNPGGKDPTQDFSKGLQKGYHHPPVNYHAYAACMGGCFAAHLSDVRASHVLLLLRKDLRGSLEAAKKLRKQNIPFWISWKEAGRHQVAQVLSHPPIWGRFQQIASLARGFLASTPWLVTFYRACGLREGCFIPTPYPCDFSEWDFSILPEERSGIFLGTREFLIPSRNHAAALTIACELASRYQTHITCINQEGRYGRTLLQNIDEGRGVLQIIEGRLSYEDYLGCMAKHRLVFQLDRSGVPGQVAGDAILCGIPCLGGDGAIDDILNPMAYRDRYQTEACIGYIEKLLGDFSFYLETVQLLRYNALEKLSFRVGKESIREFLGGYE